MLCFAGSLQKLEEGFENIKSKIESDNITKMNNTDEKSMQGGNMKMELRFTNVTRKTRAAHVMKFNHRRTNYTGT